MVDSNPDPYRNRDSPWRDKETLERLYHGEGMTQTEVADELGCTKNTIINWMEKHGVRTMDVGGGDPDAPHKDEDTLRWMYEDQRMNTYEMADELGPDASTLRYWMDKFGIERVPMGPGVTPPSMWTDPSGYEVWKNGSRTVGVHQLLAVAAGYDPHDVFAPDTDVHHPNGLSWGNWHTNVEVVDHDDHARIHAVQTEFWKYRDNYRGETSG